jgi:UDP-N-acetylglucosamine 2-epimerase
MSRRRGGRRSLELNRITVVVGTRPEVIKMAPVVLELRRRDGCEACLVSTGQHRDLSAQALGIFGLRPDHDLRVMRRRQELPGLTSVLIEALSRLIRASRPDAVLVQGDTTTVLAAALAAFYERVPLAHVEAGLRSRDYLAPWPEEMNRRLTDAIAQWCFAPTDQARRNLVAEGIAEDRIHVTGNTVIDALLWIRERLRDRPPELPRGLEALVRGHRVVLVTGHRRESFGPVFEGLCRAMLRIAGDHLDVALVYPVHLNPNVQEPVRRLLGGHERIRLVKPLSYDAFVWLMSRCFLVLTDSGGVQEEAPALGKPVVVMRNVSERPEGVAEGVATVAGTDADSIYRAVAGLLGSAEEYSRRARVAYPYGDGRAAERIVGVLLGQPVASWGPKP